MYRYENEKLFKINFVIFAVEALTNLDPNRYKLLYTEQKLIDLEASNNSNQQLNNKNNKGTIPSSSNQFVSTLYVGYYKNNLYAMPALVYNWHLPSIAGPITEPSLRSNDTNLIAVETKSEEGSSSSVSLPSTAIMIGHHKLPPKFNPPPNYIQPNNKLIVLSKHDDDEEANFVSSIPDIFGTNKGPLCPADKPKSKIKFEKGINLIKKFDKLMQNRYFWTIFTVLLASILPLGLNYYNERKKVRIKLNRMNITD
jgi:hypothetical protein